MAIKHFINRKTGLSTDTQPSATILKDKLYHETDTGRLYTSLDSGSTTTQIRGNTRTETLTNKMIDSELGNAFTGLDTVQESPFSPSYQVKGGLVPAADLVSSFYGVLEEGMTLHNPVSTPIIVTGEGLEVEFRNWFTGQKTGFASPVPIAKRYDGNELKIECRGVNTSRLLVGFCTQPLFSSSSSVFDLFTQKGVAVGFTENTSNFSVFNHDGSGAAAVTTAFPVAKNSTLHTIEIRLSRSNIICILDGNDSTKITLTSRIPTITDFLYLVCYGVV